MASIIYRGMRKTRTIIMRVWVLDKSSLATEERKLAEWRLNVKKCGKCGEKIHIHQSYVVDFIKGTNKLVYFHSSHWNGPVRIEFRNEGDLDDVIDTMRPH